MGTTALVNDGRSTPTVRVQGFGKRYRNQVAVRSADLRIESGEFYGLIGPDGSGKSSLMKAVAGVLAFETGTVEVFGLPVDSETAAEKIKGHIGFMPQGLGLNLYPELSVEENIDFFASLREVTAEELTLRKLLGMTRLEEFRQRPMKHLSGGMKQKLGLICTLIHAPELLILDEPTTGVDPVSRRDFWAILAELLRVQGITVLASTAYLDEASRFHRLSLMYEGEVIAEGAPEDICQIVPGSLVEVETASQIGAVARLRATFQQVESVGPLLRIFVPSGPPETARSQVAAALGSLPVTALRTAQPELEDAFVALLRQRQTNWLREHVATAGTERPSDRQFQNRVAIEACRLTRDFDSFRAADQVNFRVMQGEIFGLLGANGAGKTTVIKMLTGILPPSSGEGEVAGVDIRRTSRELKERIGYMSQAFSLYQDLTVLENLLLYARIYAITRAARGPRIDWILEMVELRGIEKRLAGKLPIGIRQRLALGCALLHRPRVLFLDEPTSGVDPIGRRRFWEILVQMARAECVAVLVTTHYMNEAEHCDHLALMHSGRIIADASPAALKLDLLREAGQLLEIAVDRPLAALEPLRAAGFEDVALFGRHIHLLARNPTQASSSIASVLERQGLTLYGISQREPSLENVFVYRILALENAARAI